MEQYDDIDDEDIDDDDRKPAAIEPITQDSQESYNTAQLEVPLVNNIVNLNPTRRNSSNPPPATAMAANPTDPDEEPIDGYDWEMYQDDVSPAVTLGREEVPDDRELKILRRLSTQYVSALPGCIRVSTNSSNPLFCFGKTDCDSISLLSSSLLKLVFRLTRPGTRHVISTFVDSSKVDKGSRAYIKKAVNQQANNADFFNPLMRSGNGHSKITRLCLFKNIQLGVIYLDNCKSNFCLFLLVDRLYMIGHLVSCPVIGFHLLTVCSHVVVKC
jgi:hypothetical protein